MNNKKGLSLLELVITMFIVLLVLGGAYLTYTNLLKGFKTETLSAESEMEKLVGSEIIRLDLEHAGYGVGRDENVPPIEWIPSQNRLVIRSTLNNTNNKTFGWLLIKCDSASSLLKDSIVVDRRYDKSNQYIILLDAKKKIISTSSFLKIDNTTTCPDKGIFAGFPIDMDVINRSGSACINQYCHEVVYRLSSYKNRDKLKDCNPDTHNLLRNNKPVLDCVSDFKIRYGIDTDGDGLIDKYDTRAFFDNDRDGTLDSSASFTDIDGNGAVNSWDLRRELKIITLYLLIQDGKYDPGYNFNNSTGYIEVDGLKLNLPPDYQHYRWRILKISVKPMNL